MPEPSDALGVASPVGTTTLVGTTSSVGATPPGVLPASVDAAFAVPPLTGMGKLKSMASAMRCSSFIAELSLPCSVPLSHSSVVTPVNLKAPSLPHTSQGGPNPP